MDGAVFLPPQGLLAVAMAKPVNVAGTALYNHTEGYGSYLIPAVMMVISFVFSFFMKFEQPGGQVKEPPLNMEA